MYIPDDSVREALDDFEADLKDLEKYKKLDIQNCTLSQLEDVFYNLLSLLENDNLTYLLKETRELLKEINKINDMD